MATKGIDVSAWQRIINWDAVKASGIKFAILKAGGSDDGIYTDGYFERNYAECKRVGIPVGAYWFVGKGCVSAADGEADAKQFVKRLEGKQFELPVYMDVEVTPLSKRTGATNAAIAFCNYLESKGYYAGIYGSTYSTFESRLDDSRLTRYAHWVAQYANSCSYWGTVGIWQYTSSAYVAGITTGTVDMNYLYIDYETVIKKMGRNGFKAATTKKDTKPAATAKLSVDGKWGADTTKALQKKLGIKRSMARYGIRLRSTRDSCRAAILIHGNSRRIRKKVRPLFWLYRKRSRLCRTAGLVRIPFVVYRYS